MDKLHSQGHDMDDLDRSLIELFAAEPRGSACWRRRGGSASPAAPCRPGWTSSSTGVSPGWGPELRPAALGFTVTAFVTLEISQGRRRRPRRGRPAPRGDPRGAGGAHHHRRRRPAVPDRGPLQHRPAAGDRRGLSESGIVRSSTVIALAKQIPYRVLPAGSGPASAPEPVGSSGPLDADHRLAPVAHLQLLQDAADVVAHRDRRDEQRRADLVVAPPLGDQREDLALPG